MLPVSKEYYVSIHDLRRTFKLLVQVTRWINRCTDYRRLSTVVATCCIALVNLACARDGVGFYCMFWTIFFMLMSSSKKLISPFTAEEELPDACLNDISYRSAVGFMSLAQVTNTLVNI